MVTFSSTYIPVGEGCKVVDFFIKEAIAFGRYSPTSAYVITSTLKMFVRFIEKQDVSLNEVDRSHVVDFFSSRKLSSFSKGKYMGRLDQFFKYAFEQGFVPLNPMHGIKRPRVEEKEIDFLTFEELDEVFRLERQKPKYFAARNCLILGLFTNLCLRLNDVYELKVSDVQIEAEKIFLSSRKGGKQKFLPLTGGLMKRVKEWKKVRDSIPLKRDEEFLFVSRGGNRLSRRMIQYVVESALKKVAPHKTRIGGPHILRHSGATLQLQSGTDVVTVQELLGHSSLESTRKYLHTSYDRIRDAVSKDPSFGE